MCVCVYFQVDYESEEEEGEEEAGEDVEDKDEQGEGEQENAEKSVEQPESTRVSVQRKMRGKGGGDEERLNEMRVNTVLQSNPAIERYCYDLEQELWCEVSDNTSDMNVVFFCRMTVCPPLQVLV